MIRRIIFVLAMLTFFYMDGTSAVNVRKMAFEFLKSRNEFIDDTIYSKEKNAIYIRDLHSEKEIVHQVCICFFGVYNELQNKYLLFRFYNQTIFIDPSEIKCDEALKIIRSFFKGKYPYNYNLIKKDVAIFYKWNRNKVIIVNGVPPKSWAPK